MDWETVAAAGAFVIGIVFGSFLTVRLTRVVWESAFRARRHKDVDD